MPLLELNELEQISPLFKGKMGNTLAKGLMKFLSVEELNELYDRYSYLKGPGFAEAVLNDIGLKYSICYTDRNILSLQDILPSGPFITISNHPCGHVDGVTLVDAFGKVRPDYKVMVNKILGRVAALSDNFIQVVPTGAERKAASRESVMGIKAALRHLREGGALGLFPSGAVSDLHLSECDISDREWQEPVIRLIAKAQVPIVPVHFCDGNSLLYYSLGVIDWRIRLLRLPAEVFNKKGKPFRICVGPVVTVSQQRELITDINRFRAFLRSAVYSTVYSDFAP